MNQQNHYNHLGSRSLAYMRGEITPKNIQRQEQDKEADTK